MKNFVLTSESFVAYTGTILLAADSSPNRSLKFYLAPLSGKAYYEVAINQDLRRFDLNEFDKAIECFNNLGIED